MMVIGACYGAVPHHLGRSSRRSSSAPAHYGQNLSILNLNILLGELRQHAMAGGIQTASGSLRRSDLAFHRPRLIRWRWSSSSPEPKR